MRYVFKTIDFIVSVGIVHQSVLRPLLGAVAVLIVGLIGVGLTFLH
jgi:hypothetical protein